MKKKLILSLTFIVLLIGCFSSKAFGNEITLWVGAESKHNPLFGKFNEKHSWKGISYKVYEEDKNSFEVEISTFVNSYQDDTIIIGITYNRTLFEYGDYKFGTAVTGGYQKGYCTDGFNAFPCNSNNNNESPFILPSFFFEGKIVRGNFAFSEAVRVARFGVKIVEW